MKNASKPQLLLHKLFVFLQRRTSKANKPRLNITLNSFLRLLVLLLIRKGLLRILTQLRRIARLLGESREYSGSGYHDTARRDKDYGRSVHWAGLESTVDKYPRLVFFVGKKMVTLVRERLRTTMLN